MLNVNEVLKSTKGFLAAGSRDIKISSFSIDSRSIKKGCCFIAIKGANHDGHDHISEAVKKGAVCVVARQGSVIKGLPKGTCCVFVKDTVKALGDIARFIREKADLPVIAVTGSNGKTTVKDMLHWVLSGKMRVLKNAGTKNNHIGVPLTLLGLDPAHEAAVLEFGTNHFGEIAGLARIARPNVGVITNIGPSHLEYFGTQRGVLKEKCSLMDSLCLPGMAVLNADDAMLKPIVTKKTKNPFVIGCGINNQSDYFASDIIQRKGKIDFKVNSKYKFTLNSMGAHNINNALLAIAVARAFGMSYPEISDRLASFDFPPGRLKAVIKKNVLFIDDTYNSNPNSLKTALEVLDSLSSKGRKILVMGDMLELGKSERLFHLLAGKLAAGICDVFITVGGLSSLAADCARVSGFNMQDIFACASSATARDILFGKVGLKKDDIVLVKGSRGMKMEEVLK